MITGLFILLLLQLIGLLSAVLPTASALPPQVFDWVAYFQSGTTVIGTFLPLNQFYAVFGLFVIVETILLGYKIGVTIFRWIRG